MASNVSLRGGMFASRPAAPARQVAAASTPHCLPAPGARSPNGVAGSTSPAGSLPRSLLFGNGMASTRRDRSATASATVATDLQDSDLDVIALGNLCVDIVLPMDTLPDPDAEFRREYLKVLSASPPPETSWEVGGNANFAIAASRIGLKTAVVGHTGRDVYGDFFERVLGEEGVSIEYMSESERKSFETLLCFVMISPRSDHAFCSRYDFGPFPLIPGGVGPVDPNVIRRAKAMFVNGFTFDELLPETVAAAADVAKAAGALVFFDAGPRAWTLADPSLGRTEALEHILTESDVVLCTHEEAEAMTGLKDPHDSGRALLSRSPHARWVVVKLGPKGCVCFSRDGTGFTSETSQQGFVVEVADTVGCGDSFASAVCLGLTQGKDMQTTLALASGVGAATATGRGAGRNVADPDNVRRILEGSLAAGQNGGLAEKEALVMLHESLERREARIAAKIKG